MKIRGTRFFKKTAVTISVTYLSLGLAANPAGAELFYEHNKQPCPLFLGDNASLPQACRGSHMDSVCHITQVYDHGAAFSFASGLVYTTAAALCAVSCAYPALDGLCQGASIGVGAYDMLMGMVVVPNAINQEYVAQAEAGRKDLYTASKTGDTVTSVASGALGMFAMGGALGGGGGGNAGGGGGGESTNTMACVSAGLYGAMAGWKFVNTGLFADAASKEAAKITPLQAGPASGADAMNAALWQECRSEMQKGDPSGGGVGTSAQALAATGSVDPMGSPMTVHTETRGDVRVPPLSFALGNNATGDEAGGLRVDPQAFQRMSGALAQRTGLTPEKIMAGALDGKSPEEIIASAVPATANFMADVRNNRDRVLGAAGIDTKKSAIKADTLYASANKGKGAAKNTGPDIQALLGSLFNNQKSGAAGAKGPASVTDVRFGAPVGQISKANTEGYHPANGKSLFDIVSHRWSTIVYRFIQEDEKNGVRAGALASDVPTQSLAPRRPASTPGSAAPRH